MNDRAEIQATIRRLEENIRRFEGYVRQYQQNVSQATNARDTEHAEGILAKQEAELANARTILAHYKSQNRL